MYDEETTATNPGHEGKADAVCHADGKHDIVHLGTGYGVFFSARIMGKRSGQCRDIQDDFTRVFYSYRRHDWVPEWYQTHAE
jgi:hypothetical protein